MAMIMAIYMGCLGSHRLRSSRILLSHFQDLRYANVGLFLALEMVGELESERVKVRVTARL